MGGDATMIPDRTETIARLNSYLDQQQIDDAVEMLAQFHPADIADLLESLEEEEKRAEYRGRLRGDRSPLGILPRADSF